MTHENISTHNGRVLGDSGRAQSGPNQGRDSNSTILVKFVELVEG